MASNQQRAATLQQVTGEDSGFLSSVKNFGLDAFEWTGLDHALEFIDRGRKAIALGMQDNLFATLPISPLILAANALRGELDAADTRSGYEITAEDYRDVLRGRTDKVRERMGNDAADNILGFNDDITTSSILDAYGTFTSDWVESLPRGVGNVAALARFGIAFGTDMAMDPTTYVTGGLGGMGRSAAQRTVTSSLRTSAARVTRELTEAGATGARSAIDDAVKAGRMSTIDAHAADDILEKATKAVADDDTLEWATAIDDAAGTRRQVSLYDKAKNEEVIVPLKDGEFVFDQGTYFDIQNKLAKNIETKFFDDSSDVWQAWVNTAKHSAKTNWTTGGLRLGIGARSANIPGVTPATRGLQRKGQRFFTQSKFAQKRYGTPGWQAQKVRWDSLRSKLSKTAPEQIRAAQGDSKFSYAAYLTVSQETPVRALNALGINPNLATDTANNWNTIQTAVRKMDGATDQSSGAILDRLKVSLGGGSKPDVAGLPAKVAKQVEEFSELYGQTYRDLEEVLARVDPTFAAKRQPGKVFRPVSFDEDFMIVMNELSSLHRTRLETKFTDASREAVAAGYGVDVADLDMFMGVFDTFGDAAARARPFGETAEFNWRKLGKTAYTLDGKDVPAFRNLGAMDESMGKVLEQVAKELNYDSKALRRLTESGGHVLELDPIAQMTRYIDDVSQAIQERVITGEAIRFQLAAPTERVRNPDAVLALLAEDDWFTRVEDLIKSGGGAVSDRELYQASLHVDMEVVDLGNGQSITVSKQLMQDPRYQKIIEEMQGHWRGAIETAQQFPHEFDSEIRKVKARYSAAKEEISDAAAQSIAAKQMLGSLDQMTERYLVSVTAIVQDASDRAAGMFDSVGVNVAEVPDMVEGYYAKQMQSALETVEGYRNDYVDIFMQDAQRMESIDLFDMAEVADFESFILNSGARKAEFALEAATEGATELRRVANEVVAGGGSVADQVTARYNAEVAEHYAAALNAKLTGEPLPRSGVSKVTIRQIGNEIEDQAALPQRILDAIGGSDEGIVLDTSPFNRLHDRATAVTNADHSLFMFHPLWADDKAQTFRILRYAVDGTHPNHAPIGNEIAEWWEANMVSIVPGVYVSRNPEAKVTVVTRLFNDGQQQSDMVNFIQHRLRSSNPSGAEIVVEMPDVVRRSFSRETTKQYVASGIGATRMAQDALPNLTPSQRRWIIEQYNGHKQMPHPIKNEGRARRAAIGQRDIEDAASFGLEFDMEENRWLWTGEGDKASEALEANPILGITPQDLEAIDELYPNTIDQLVAAEDIPTTTGFEGQTDVVLSETDLPPVIQGPTAPGAEIEPFVPSQAARDVSVPPSTTRRDDLIAQRNARADAVPNFFDSEEAKQFERAIRDAERGTETGLDELARQEGGAIQASPVPAVEARGAGRIEGLRLRMADDMRQLGIPDEEIVDILESFTKGLVDTSRQQGVTLSMIIKKAQREAVESMRWRLGRATSADAGLEMVYPVGTVIELPEEAVAISWLQEATASGQLDPIFGEAQLRVRQETPGKVKGRPSEFTPIEEARAARGDAAEFDRTFIGGEGRDEFDILATDPDVVTGREEFGFGDVDRPTDVVAAENRLIDIQAAERGFRTGAEQSDDLNEVWRTPKEDGREIAYQHQITGDLAEFSEVLFGQVFGRSRSPEDFLRDPVRDLITRQVYDGPVNATRGVWQDPAVVRSLSGYGIQMQSVSEKLVRLQAGEIAVLQDPEFVKWLAIVNDRHTWATDPDTWAAMHPGREAPSSVENPALKKSVPDDPQPGGKTYEVSTAGDRRYSALVAEIQGRGNRTIEEIYQIDVKGWDTVKEGKNKPPKAVWESQQTQPAARVKEVQATDAAQRAPDGPELRAMRQLYADLENEKQALISQGASDFEIQNVSANQKRVAETATNMKLQLEDSSVTTFSALTGNLPDRYNKLLAVEKVGTEPVPVKAAESPTDAAEIGMDAFEAMGDDELITVYHATDAATADEFIENGITAANKKVTPEARQRFEPGETGAGLYVGNSPETISIYAFPGVHKDAPKKTVAITVKKGDLQIPRESGSSPNLTPDGNKWRALTTDRFGATIEGDIPSSNIRIVGDEAPAAPTARTDAATPAAAPKVEGVKLPTRQETAKAYDDLWREWADENPEALQELADLAGGRPLSDKYTTKGAVANQADSLQRIMAERGVKATPVSKVDDVADQFPAFDTPKRLEPVVEYADTPTAKLEAELAESQRIWKFAKLNDLNHARNRLKWAKRKIKELDKGQIDQGTENWILDLTEEIGEIEGYLVAPAKKQELAYRRVKGRQQVPGQTQLSDAPIQRTSDTWAIEPSELEAATDALKTRMALYQHQLDLQIQTYDNMMQVAEQSADSQLLVDAMGMIRDLNEVDDFTQLPDMVAQANRLLGNEKDRLTRAAKAAFGDEVEVALTAGGDAGRPTITISRPYGDTAAIENAYGDFDGALAAMIDGELTMGEAYRKGMPQVAKAYEAQQALQEALSVRPAVVSEAKHLAETANIMDFYRQVTAAVQRAIDTGNTKQLRNLVVQSEGQGKLGYTYTKQMRQLMDSLQSSPEQLEFLQRFIEAGWVKDLEWANDRAFRRWWQQERNMMGALDWSTEQNAILLQRLTDQIMQTEYARISPEQLGDTARLFGELTADVAGIRGRLANIDHMLQPQGADSLPFAAGAGSAGEYRTKAQAAYSRSQAKRRAANATFSERVDNVELVLDSIVNNPGYQRLDNAGQLAENARIKQARKLLDDLRKVTDQDATYQRAPRQGLMPAGELGLGSGILSEFDIDPIFAEFLSSTVNNSKTLFTPYVTSELQRVTRNLITWWKGAATVVKPSFHIRNVIGGVTNGYIAGVHMSDYKYVLNDVKRFRRALARVESTGTGQIGSDVFEREVIGAVSEANQEAFRQAWDQGVMQTSFTRAENLYTPGSKLSWKPWERNWAAFQWGGQAMESIEDVMRMAAFTRHFDSTADDLLSEAVKAKSIVDAVHFDYTALTPIEEKVKNFMPFYVWTRRNIPLQMRVLTQNPTFMLWYGRARANWNEQQLSTMEDVDPLTRYQATQGFMLPFQRGDDESWARLMWDPQLPAYDLDNLPIFEAGSVLPIGMSMFNLGAWSAFMVDNAGPAISTPFRIAQAQEDGGSTNAPAGINAVFDAIDNVPVVNQLLPEQYQDATSSFAPDSDFRISKTIKELVNTAVPFYSDYRAMLGIKPNNPYIAAGEGWVAGDDPHGLEAMPLRFGLGPLGRVSGRGAGFSWFTPTDVFFNARETESKLSEMELLARYKAGIGNAVVAPEEEEFGFVGLGQ